MFAIDYLGDPDIALNWKQQLFGIYLWPYFFYLFIESHLEL